MTDRTGFTTTSLPLRGNASPGTKSPYEKPQNTPVTDFALLLNDNGPVPVEETAIEQLPALPAPSSAGPAKISGNDLPVAGTSLPVAGTALQSAASEASADEAPGARKSDEPDGNKQRSPADPVDPKPSAIILKAAAKTIDGVAALKTSSLPFAEAPQEQPKPSAEPAKLPPPDNAAKHMIQLLRPMTRDRLTVIAVQGEQIDPVSTTDTGRRPIMPIAAADNSGASVQHFGQHSSALTPSPASLAQPQTMLPAHDFEGMVDRLVEAREAANSGRAQMAVRHDEFGQISVRLEHAAAGMKFALSSMDADFSPAVQSALATRITSERSDLGELLSGNSGDDRHAPDAHAFGHRKQSDSQSNNGRPPADDAPILSASSSTSTRSAKRHETGLYA